ncbi:hypothetical protein ASPTUDRAFT_46712 [Aspergillus tubingensis CBS 134.48]|uniref:Uncharacterized protein n=1 Tax=Aspergillus tubingensis (strain CBS 134.48) TaxID=767770 RepID=A0A1L9MWE1_ASPTC|nr:hypothetical protein ASPTUDRAFT_46712 [Aspergillus tubingensis CBS 134.48]
MTPAQVHASVLSWTAYDAAKPLSTVCLASSWSGVSTANYSFRPFRGATTWTYRKCMSRYPLTLSRQTGCGA